MTSPSPTQPKKVPLSRLLVPVFAFLAMLVWSNVPPYRAHIKKEDRGYFVWHWHLYWQGGLKVCDLRYYDMNKGGEQIERWKLLGFDEPGDMPDNIARIHYNQLRADQTRVCDALREQGDPKPNVELAARCGFGYGWKPVVGRKSNVCALTSGGKAKPKPKPQPKRPPTKPAQPAQREVE